MEVQMTPLELIMLAWSGVLILFGLVVVGWYIWCEWEDERRGL